MAILTKDEVKRRVGTLEGCIAANEPPCQIIDILNELNDGVVATDDIIATTGVLGTLKKLAQHPEPVVFAQAIELADKWKAEAFKPISDQLIPSSTSFAGIVPGDPVSDSTIARVEVESLAELR